MVSAFVTPVAVYALQRYYDYWETNSPGLFQLTALLISGAFNLEFVHFPLLTLPISLALYLIAEVDVARLLYINPTESQYDWVSVVFGALMIAGSYLLDKIQQKKKKQDYVDYAFWSYIYGVMAFFGGFSDLRYRVYDQNVTFEWIYLIVNLAMCGLTPLLQRNVFILFGSLGASAAVVDFLATEATITENAWIAICFGTVLTIFGIVTEKKNPSSSVPFWVYMVGCSAFSGGLDTLFVDQLPFYDNQIFKFIFFLINIGLCVLTLYTQYRVFLIHGVFGCLWYIEEIVYRYYWNSWWLPVILTVIGLGIIALAIYFSRQTLAKLRQRMRPQHQEVEMNESLKCANIA